MASYTNRDPNATEMLLKKRKLTVPTLLDEPADDQQDTTQSLLDAATNVDSPYKNYNTEDVTLGDAFPGQTLSPVRVETAGSLYGSVPVVTGGQILYPVGLAHKRNKARLEQDALEQEREAKVRDLFGMQIAAPAMAPAIQKFYFEEVNKRMQDVYKTLGREKATSVLGDITNPITQNVLKPYADYKEAVRASFDVQTAMQKVTDEVNKGERVMSSATKQELKDIQEGTWLKKTNPDGSPRTIKDYGRIPSRFETFATLDTKFKALKDQGLLEPDVNEVIERGVTIDGKKINSLNGHQLLDEVTRSAVSSPRIQALKQNILSDPSLSPDVTEDDVDKRINALVRSEAHKVISIAPQSSSGGGDDAEKAAAVDKRYEHITSKLIAGDSQSFADVAKGKPYKDGTITNVKIKPAGSQVKEASTGKTSTLDHPVTLIEYSTTDKFGINHKQQDEVHGEEEIINVANDWYNFKKEGTTGYIDREDITTRFKGDERFGDYKPAKKTSQSKPTSKGQTYKTDNGYEYSYDELKSAGWTDEDIQSLSK